MTIFLDSDGFVIGLFTKPKEFVMDKFIHLVIAILQMVAILLALYASLLK